MNNLIIAAANFSVVETLLLGVFTLLAAIICVVVIIFFILEHFKNKKKKNHAKTQEISHSENQCERLDESEIDDFQDKDNYLKENAICSENSVVDDKKSAEFNENLSITEHVDLADLSLTPPSNEEVENIFNQVFSLPSIGEADKENLEKNQKENFDRNESKNCTYDLSKIAAREEIADTLIPSFTGDAAEEYNDLLNGDFLENPNEGFDGDVDVDLPVTTDIFSDEHDDFQTANDSINSLDKPYIAGAPSVRYLRSFTAKLCQSNDLLKVRYSEVKNDLLSFKNVKARMSWFFETFRIDNRVIAKLSINGKTLSLYLALSPQNLAGTKYHFKDVSQYKKYADTPLRMIIESKRSVKWAKELIAAVAEQNNLLRFACEEVDYLPEYRDLEELIKLKEVKVESTAK